MKTRAALYSLAVLLALVVVPVAGADSCAAKAASCGAKGAAGSEVKADCPKADTCAARAACTKDKANCPKSCCAKDAAPSAKAEVGAAAPDFTLTSADGAKTVTLSELRGKIVVVQFFNHECPWVAGSWSQTQALHEKYGEKGVKFVAVDCTHNHTAEAVAAQAQEHGLTFPILMNQEGHVGKAYQASRTPETYVIDKEGIVRFHGAFDNRTQPAAAGDVNYVEQAITSLLGDKPVEITQKNAFGCMIKYKA